MPDSHDVGGRPAGAIETGERDLEPWEKRADALVSLLTRPGGAMNDSELRRGIESLGPEAYDELSYYERWIASTAFILVEKGLLTQSELDAKVNELKGGESDGN